MGPKKPCFERRYGYLRAAPDRAITMWVGRWTNAMARRKSPGRSFPDGHRRYKVGEVRVKYMIRPDQRPEIVSS